MIGEKKPSEIRADILAALKKSVGDPTSWLNQQIARLERNSSPDPAIISTLKGLRDGVPKREPIAEQSAKRRAKTRNSTPVRKRAKRSAKGLRKS